jgi:imidazolonepropionase-like amidohydrolase/Tol biopolymer transport system component
MSCLNRLIRDIQKRSLGPVRHERKANRYPGRVVNTSTFYVLGGVIVSVLCVSPAAAQSDDWRPIELETSQVTESDVTVSPDGRWLVFSILGHLFRLPPAGGTAEQLTFGPYLDIDPVFSPDGEKVAFVSDRDGSEGNIFVLDLATGAITQVSHELWAARPSWSRDAQVIAYLRVLREEVRGNWPAPIPGQVRWVTLEGGEVQTLDGPPRQFRSTFYLPDGRLGWSVIEEDPESGRRISRIEILRSDRTVSTLRVIDGLVDRVVPASDGDGLYCHRVQEVYAEYLAVTQPAHLTYVPLPEAEARPIFPVSETSRYYWFGRPRFGVDGGSGVIYLADAGRLWAVSPSDGTRRPVVFNALVRMEIRNPLSPLTFRPPAPGGSRPPRVALDPILSPDGNTLVFEATGDLWMQNSEGGPARQLLDGPGLEWLASFSPDGRRIAFVQELSGQQSLKVFDRETGQVQTLLSGERYVYPAWSPDGQHVVFVTRSGVAAVHLRDGGTETLTNIRVDRPHFSGDGRYLYGTADNTVYRLLLEGEGEPEPMTRLAGSVSEGIVSPDGRWLVFGRDFGIWVARLGAGPVEETDIRQLTSEGEGDFSLSADGTAVVYAAGNRVLRQPLAGGAREELPLHLTLQHPIPPPLLLQGVRVLDLNSGAFGSETDLLIEGGRIRRVGVEGERELRENTVTLDAAGRFAIPGLFDMHVHAGGANLAAFVAYGVTSVRDVGGGLRWLSALADRSEATNGPVPRLFYSGDIFGGQFSKTDAEARDCVRRWKQGGAQFIKVYSTLPWPLRAAAVEEARLLGLPVVAHGTNIGEIVRGVTAGYISLEHTALSSRFYDDVHSLLAAAGTRWTPTLAIREGNALLFRFEPERLTDSKLRAFFPERWIGAAQSGSRVRSVPDKVLNGLVAELLAGVGAAQRSGVKLLAGTDVPVCPECFTGASLHWELELFVRAGLTPLGVLRIATLDAATTVGAEDDLGSIEVGKLADIVLLDANPLEDIKNTQNIWRVIKGGWVFDPEELAAQRSKN